MASIDIGDIFDERMIVTSVAFGIMWFALGGPEFFGESFMALSFIGVIAVWYLDAWFEGSIRGSGIAATIVLIVLAMQLIEWLVGGLSLGTLLFLAYIVVLQNTSRTPILMSIWIANVVAQGMKGNASIKIFPTAGIGLQLIWQHIIDFVRDAIQSLTGSAQYTGNPATPYVFMAVIGFFALAFIYYIKNTKSKMKTKLLSILQGGFIAFYVISLLLIYEYGGLKYPNCAIIVGILCGMILVVLYDAWTNKRMIKFKRKYSKPKNPIGKFLASIQNMNPWTQQLAAVTLYTFIFLCAFEIGYLIRAYTLPYATQLMEAIG